MLPLINPLLYDHNTHIHLLMVYECVELYL